jgi:alpha,alpha-trehalose phosphorylase (configuration-retaining)
MWAGIAGSITNGGTSFEIAVSVHDSVYSTDFSSTTIPYNPADIDGTSQSIQHHVLDTLRKFSIEHLCKFLGAGVTLSLLKEVRIPSLDLLMTSSR